MLDSGAESGDEHTMDRGCTEGGNAGTEPASTKDRF